MSDLGGMLGALEGMPVVTEGPVIKQKSRDFYWYSPVLKRQLDDVAADAIVTARSEADVIAVLKAAYAHDVPVTVRGAGTGNYGQAMPLKGGVVLDLSEMTAVKEIAPGRVRCEAGIKMHDLDAATREHSGQEARFHPSTKRTASIGGYVAGGSSGVGSITWGLLRDRGNILGTRVVTMEAEPRILELRGDDINQVNHAYGTNGVITEVEMPLAPAYGWIDMIAVFDDFMEACRFSQALSEQDAIVKKLVTPIAAPVPDQYFKPLKNILPEGKNIVLLMIADIAVEAFEAFFEGYPGEIVYRQTADDKAQEGVPPLYEFSWNHTTLQALKVDRNITYLQTLFPPPDHLALVEKMYTHFGDEVPMHLEFVRFGGQIACFGLQVVRFTTEERLWEIIAFHEANGCPIFNPHTCTLEEGGMKQVDHLQLDFKKQADPKGLMNPGKMLAWEDPDWTPEKTDQVHLYPAGG